MKKIISVIICCLFIVLTACSSAKYKRISFDNDEMGEDLIQHIDSNTKVVDKSSESFSPTFPVYKISEHKISKKEANQVLKQLEFEDYYSFKLDGNRITGSLVSYLNTTRGYFNMTDDEVEKLAWETFNKLPFMDGTYEYLGIKSTMTVSDSKGTHITRAGVSFRRILDGIRVVGNDQCYLYFDGTGLVEFHIEIYDYKKINTMDMLPLESASSMIKTPDSFSIDTENTEQKLGVADTLQVEQIKLIFYNQYSRGCTILQPVYSFVGTATDADGVQAEFNSLVIAIPESYTYENE